MFQHTPKSEFDDAVSDEADGPVADPSEIGADPPATSLSIDQLGLGPLRPVTLADRIEDAVAGLDRFRDRPAVVAALVAALLAVAIAVTVPRWSSEPLPIEDRIPQVALTPTSAVEADDVSVIVHVSGAVAVPGVYALPSSSRVVEAVEAAGGANGDADLHQLNLAAVVVDGQQIRVPEVGELLPTLPAAGGSGPVDLNRGDVLALQSLSGIGPATAEAIIAFREEHGPFRSVDDLLDVPGIGPSKLAAISDAVVVR